MSVKKAVDVKTIDDNPTEKIESVFSKEQLLSSEKFRDRRDVINALLSSDKQYTMKAVEKMIDDYMKGRVK